MNKDNQPKKTEQSAKTGKKSGKGRRVGRTIGIVLGTILLVTVLTSAIFVGIFMTYVNTSLKGHVEVDMSEYDQKVSTELYYQDPDTKELVMYQTLFGDENRIWVDFDSIPKNLREATIAIEDKRFESHHGVDWHGTVRAVFRTLTKGNTQGGSTITQQLIKNVTGNNENTVKRKVTEVYRALALEKDYSKDEILEMYLNTIYLGNQCYGVQTASRMYFHKDVSELTLAECACLISITNNPSQYDPLRSDWTREQNRNRQLDVLDAMLAQEKIDQATYDAAKAQEVVFTNGYTNLGSYVGPQEEDEKPAVVSTANNSYFTDEVITDVAEKFVEVFGLTDDPADADGYVRTAFEKAVSKVYNGGYKIYTTQNPRSRTSPSPCLKTPTTPSIPTPRASRSRRPSPLWTPTPGTWWPWWAAPAPRRWTGAGTGPRRPVGRVLPPSPCPCTLRLWTTAPSPPPPPSTTIPSGTCPATAHGPPTPAAASGA